MSAEINYNTRRAKQGDRPEVKVKVKLLIAGDLGGQVQLCAAHGQSGTSEGGILLQNDTQGQQPVLSCSTTILSSTMDEEQDRTRFVSFHSKLYSSQNSETEIVLRNLLGFGNFTFGAFYKYILSRKTIWKQCLGIFLKIYISQFFQLQKF